MRRWALDWLFDILDLRHKVDWLPYIPLGVVGMLSWTVWLLRKGPSLFYRSVKNDHTEKASVITAVYDESPAVLRQAIESWQRNDPDEIIAVIDHRDAACIQVAHEFGDAVKLIVVGQPGKRGALAEGIRAARNDIVVLVDSDTFWEPDLLQKLVMPFADAQVGGVGARQNVYQSHTSLWRRVADWYLDLKYLDFVPSMSRRGAINCLSGRTAAYRRSVVMPLLDDLVHEEFWGTQCVGGDDGRLTSLVLKAGYKTVYQGNARAYTVFPDNLEGFVNQRIRWSRNSYRCNLRAMAEGWVWRKPWILPLSMLHTMIGPFSLWVSFSYLLVTAFLGDWVFFWALLVWSIAGRSIKGISHLRRAPRDVLLLPLIPWISILLLSPIKAYALVTLNKQAWLTRGDEKPSLSAALVRRLRFASALGVSAVLLLSITAASATIHLQKVSFGPPEEPGEPVSVVAPAVITPVPTPRPAPTPTEVALVSGIAATPTAVARGLPPTGAGPDGSGFSWAVIAGALIALPGVALLYAGIRMRPARDGRRAGP
jgi:hyaluronan synthase